MPVILAGNKEQQKKYLGRMVEEVLMAVSIILWNFKHMKVIAFCSHFLLIIVSAFNLHLVWYDILIVHVIEIVLLSRHIV